MRFDDWLPLSGLFEETLQPLLQDNDGRRGKRLRGDAGVGAVDHHQHISLAAGGEVARIVRGNFDRHLRPAGNDGLLQLGTRRHLADDLHERSIFELLDEQPALLRARLIEYHGRNVFRRHVDDAEENQLEDRYEEREKESSAIAHHLRQLFAKDRHESVHACITSGRAASISRPRVSVSRTKTSSSDGSISLTFTPPIPNASRSRSTCSFEASASIRRCSEVPKIVASRT